MVPMERLRAEEVHLRLQQHTHHELLRRTRVGPQVSRFHFEVAKTILYAAKVPQEEATQVLEAVLLLQQGLALHDRVDDETGLRRQLHVLAGDYCSSQYYRLLSRVQNEALLVELCSAVMRINEAKMELYRTPGSVQETDGMGLMEIIEGELLFALARHYLDDPAAWMPQIRSLVRAHIVKKEMGARKVPKYFTLRQAYEWLGEASERIVHMQANAILQPIASFITEYILPAQKSIESQFFVEGNHL
jgi:heptaprenyl diphosphate synthase